MFVVNWCDKVYPLKLSQTYLCLCTLLYYYFSEPNNKDLPNKVSPATGFITT